MVVDSNWNGLWALTWDMKTDTILGFVNLTSRPDHVSMTPSGLYCLISSDAEMLYDRDLTNPRNISNSGEHSDIGIDKNGDDIYISIDYGANNGTIYIVNLRTNNRKNLLHTYTDSTTTACHFSGKNFNKPGWFVWSTYGEGGDPYTQQWYHRKIMIIEMAANPKIYQVGNVQCVYGGYWTEPHATTSRDLTRIAFTSDWNTDTDIDVDTYLYQIPSNLF
jgi:hypothetical protein